MPDTLTYLQSVGAKHRRDYGQFFTHPDVARFMVEWVLESGQPRLYDPAFGLGAFRTPVSINPQIIFTASEIDSTVISFYAKATGMEAGFVIHEDYLLSWGKRHTNIVCNPPYVRFQKFLDRDRVFAAFAKNLGCGLSGYTNTASAFLLKSLSEMDGSGRLAYIMPLEFLNTGYGTAVKAKLIEDGHLAAIIHIDCEKDVFPDATTSIGIILFDAAARHADVRFYALPSIAALAQILTQPPLVSVAVSDLKPDVKWLPYFQRSSFIVDGSKTVPLRHYGRFSRGIATGANEFFVLSQVKAKERGFLSSECVPCITRSAQIKKAVFEEKDFLRMKEENLPVLLLAMNDNPSRQAMKYIQDGEQRGFHERFLTKNRRPWYKTEVRTPAPLLLGVFSRGGYKIILNRSSALNLTCYHGFQPNLYGTQYVSHLFLYLLSKAGHSILSLSIRQYGNGLDKFEPNDLNAAWAPSPDCFDGLSMKEVNAAIRHVEETDALLQGVEEFFAALKNPT